jgi:ATP-dependent helicase HrpB
MLTKKALERGLTTFVDADELESLRERLRFLSENLPDLGAPLLDRQGEEAVLRAASEGRTRFAELRESNPLGLFLYALPPAVREGLEKMAPTHITLPGGRRLRVHYEAGKPPWVESRLQDFFGMKQTPTLAGGRVPLVIHLLAPNQRAVQVTTDLAGFWERAYPPLRKELGRRYPRHSWPENPLTAEPPSRR